MATPFETIADHCVRNNKNDCVRDLAFSIFRQQFESLTLGKVPVPDAAAVLATEQTLLAPGSLVAHTRAAEELLRKQFENEAKQLQSQIKRESFWFSVITGIVGNIIYSILLIVIFIVAKDQLSTWLSSLAQNQSSSLGAPHETKKPGV